MVKRLLMMICMTSLILGAFAGTAGFTPPAEAPAGGADAPGGSRVADSDNDFSSATNIPKTTSWLDTDGNVTSTDDPEDYWQIYLTASATNSDILTINISCADAQGVWLELTDPDQHTILIMSNDAGSAETHHTLYPGSTGFHYIIVRPSGTSLTKDYTISTIATTGNTNADFDSNNRFTKSETILDGHSDTHLIDDSTDIQDFYDFLPVGDSHLTVTVGVPTGVDIEMELFNQAKYLQAHTHDTNTGTGGTEAIVVPNVLGQTYYLRIFVEINLNTTLTGGSGNYQLDFSLALNNRAPEINGTGFDSDDYVDEDNNLTRYDLDDIFTDPDDDTLTFDFMSDGVNVTVVVWEENRTVTFVPALNWYGTENITFYANDTEMEVSDIVHLTVDPVNDPPVINLSAGNDTFNATVGIPFIMNITASDPVENHTILAYYNEPDIMFKIDRDTGEINFTPTEDDVGNHTFNITVWDSGDEDTLPAVSYYSNFTIIVNITNRPPVVDPVEHQEARQGELLVVPVNYYDLDPGDNLSLRIDVITNATITAPEWNATSGNLTWNATNDDVIALAPYNFTFAVNFTVTDLGNLSAWTAFNISVLNANDPPSAPGIGLNDTMDFEEGDNGTYIVTTPDLMVHFWGFPAADPDLEIPFDQEDIPGYYDEELDYSWDFGDDDSEGDDGTLEMSHQYAAPGNYTVNLTVIDDGGFEAVATLIISLLLEEAPGFTPAELTQAYTDPEGDVYSYAISIDLDKVLSVVSGGKNTDKRPEMDLVSLGSEYMEGEASFTVTLRAAANISTTATDEYWLVIVPQGTQENGSHLNAKDLDGEKFDYIWPPTMLARISYNPWTETATARTPGGASFLLVEDDEITVQRSGKSLKFTIALSALPKMGIDPGTAVEFWGVALGSANKETEDLEELQKILEGKTWLGEEYFDTIGPGAANMSGMSTWGAFSGGDGEDDDGLSDAAVAALVIIMVVGIIIILIALLVAKGRVKDEVIVEEEGADAPAMRESMGWEGGYEDEFEFECPECSTPVPLDLEGCPSCGMIFETNMFLCPTCRAEVAHDAEECSECGTSFGEPTGEEEEGLEGVTEEEDYEVVEDPVIGPHEVGSDELGGEDEIVLEDGDFPQPDADIQLRGDDRERLGPGSGEGGVMDELAID